MGRHLIVRIYVEVLRGQRGNHAERARSGLVMKPAAVTPLALIMAVTIATGARIVEERG
jgi:hypothetical protein